MLPHFTTVVEDMNLEPDLLMQIVMDGPNDNSNFEKDLYTQINDRYGVSFLMLGSCGIHITNNGFRKGVTEFGFDVETFVNDISLYFKMSAAQRQDYKLMEMFTEIEAKYALKHTIVRWLSLKNPILRILEQW